MKRELQLKVEELYGKLKSLEAPDAPKGWLPFGLSGKEFVLASREKGTRIEIKPFRREGIWGEIGKYIHEREKILNEIEEILRRDPEYDVILF